MAVTLLYAPLEAPGGTVREAAVYETVGEALFQAAWDSMVGQNRDPMAIIDGAHHGSPGWSKPKQPKYHPEETSAHDVEADSPVDLPKILPAAVKIVRKHWIVHPDDAANDKLSGFGEPRVRPNDPVEASPSVADCFAELEALV